MPAKSVVVPKVKIGSQKLSFDKNSNSAVDRELQAARRNSSKRYRDSGFRLSDASNYENDADDQIMAVGNRTFIDEIDPSDICQGEAGDCWFLSSLCSFANYVNIPGQKKTDLLEKVIQASTNNTAKNSGAYIFQFYQFGEWHKVLIDELLPLKVYKKKKVNGTYRRGMSFNPEIVEDYWALLLEKAFAKLVGGYMKLEGGFPKCALTYLCGGITTDDLMDSAPAIKTALEDENLFDYLESIEEKAMIVASNYENDEPDLGLIAGHAYAVVDFEVIGGTKLVQLQNPWGEGEWHGEWGDDWLDENKNTDRRLKNLTREQKEKLRVGENLDDGKFWMAWVDFITEFECLTVCHLDDPEDKEKRCIGTFEYGKNSPGTSNDMAIEYLNPSKHVQFKLEVASRQLMKFQMQLDLPMKPSKTNPEVDQRLVFMAVHNVPEKTKELKLSSKLELYEMDLLQPRLPLNRPDNQFKGYAFEHYDFNGWVYDMNPGTYILVMGSGPVSKTPGRTPATDFIFRIRGADFNIEQLK